MARVVRFHTVGGPDVLRLEQEQVGSPGPGQVRLRQRAVGLNFADIYFRDGTYQVSLPSGIGVEAAGIVEEVGADVTQVAAGDRVTYTGFLDTLGAYCTERLVAAAPLIRLPAGISLETAAAMTIRGLTAAYLMRRIHPWKAGDTLLLHAAAGCPWCSTAWAGRPSRPRSTRSSAAGCWCAWAPPRAPSPPRSPGPGPEGVPLPDPPGPGGLHRRSRGEAGPGRRSVRPCGRREHPSGDRPALRPV